MFEVNERMHLNRLWLSSAGTGVQHYSMSTASHVVIQPRKWERRSPPLRTYCARRHVHPLVATMCSKWCVKACHPNVA